MAQQDDVPDDVTEGKTIRVLELKEDLIPDELVPYARLWQETSGLWHRAVIEQDAESSPPLDTLEDLKSSCSATQLDVLDTVREEHPEAIGQVIAERGL